MTVEEFQLLFAYDRWANNRMLQSVSSLSTEQFMRVRGTLVHIVGGEWGWLTYFNEPSPDQSFLEGVWDRHDLLFAPEAFPDFASVQARWQELEQQQLQFLSTLTDERLQSRRPFFTTQVTLAQLMQHAANHSTYHRGQVALLLRQQGVQPAVTDFHAFLLSAAETRDLPA